MSSLKTCPSGCLFALICAAALNTSYAQVTSNFDVVANTIDGWSTTVASQPYAPNYNSTGGNLGGDISVDLINPSTPYYFYPDRYFDAPAKFLGNKSTSYNQNLTFDLQQSLNGTDLGTAELVLSGGGVTIVFPVSAVPSTTSWTPYSVLLKETAGWKTGSLAGAATTLKEMKLVLSNLVYLRIRANYFPNPPTFPVGTYSCRLDNVVLNQAGFPTPPMITSFSPSSGVSGTTITITGNNFNATAAQNLVYFNGVKGTVVTASATQLTVTSPGKISFGPITLTNLANGTQATSSQNFNPLFNNNKDFGGQIVPSSFGSKIDFGTSSNEVGMSVGDLDGDGFIDVLTSGNNLNASVFRNLGQVGSVSASSFAAPLILAIPNGQATPPAVARVGQNAIADMDGDGKLDLVINVGYNLGGNEDNGMAIFLNQSTPGNLSFSSGTVFQFSTVNNNNGGMSIVDMDGDGRPEFLGTLNNSGCHLGIALNLSSPGNLDFAAVQDFAGGATMGGPISWGDLNGDGKPEIISEAYLGGSVFVWENTSTLGTLSMGTAFSVSTVTTSNFQVIDFDNDGKAEFFFKDYFSGTIHIKKNAHTTGPLTTVDFSTDIALSTFYTGSGNVGYVGCADINGDGLVDIVSNNGTNVIVYQNYFSGTLSAASFGFGVTFQGQDNSNSQVICADIDGDNKPDILVKPQTGTTGKNFRVYHNECYPAPKITSITPSPTSAGNTVTLTGDLFQNGLTTPTVIVHNGVLKATASASSNTNATAVIPAGSKSDNVTVTVHGLTSAPATLPITFPTSQVINSSSFGTGIDFALNTNTNNNIAIADFDDDGKIDVGVVDNFHTGKIFQNTQAIAGQPITTASLTQLTTTFSSFSALTAFDIDGDGKQDISSGYSFFQNASSPGTISFPTAPGGTSISHNFGVAATADFNKDGKIDLATIGGTAVVGIYENRSGNGAFSNVSYFSTFSATPVNLTRTSTNGAIATADFDGDGNIDIATADDQTGTNEFAYFRNLGVPGTITTASFAAGVTVPTGLQPFGIAAADYDGDGKPDVAITHFNAANNYVSVFRNTSVAGTISFAAAVNFSCVKNGFDMVAQDLDGDGKPEMIVIHQPSPGTGSYSIFQNTGTSGSISFAPVVNYPISHSPQELAIADINQDNKPDILIVGNGTNALSVYENKMVLPVPTITSFTPASGPIGTTVTITGTNFDPTPGNSTVKFNGTSAVVTAITTTSITTLVPAGATTGTITVNAWGTTATSVSSFTVTAHVPLGNVVLMNGTTDYIEIPDNAAVDPTNLTLEAWVNFSSILSFNPIFNKVVGTAINDTYQLFLAGGALKGTVESFAGLNTFAQVAWTPTLGQWYHLAFTYDDATRSETLYIDGAMVATNVVGASPQYDTGPLYIGGDRDNGTTYYSFPGKIDEARIWNVARTQTNILTTINTSLIGNETGLVAYYKMDEVGQGAGITVANSTTASGATINGTTFGTSCTPIFTVNPGPTISSFTPSSGPIGIPVIITGTSFDPVAANNIVQFNGTAASVTSSTTTSINTMAPAGTTSGTISVSVGCNSAVSSGSFTITPTPIITINPQPASVYSVCDGAMPVITTVATGTTNIIYQWQFSSDGIQPFADLTNTGGYSNVGTSSLTINSTGNFGAGVYRCKIDGDFAATVYTNTVSFTVNAVPAAPTSSNVSNCGPGSVTLNASGGSAGQYMWYDMNGVIAGQNNSSYSTPVISVISFYSVAINNGTCVSTKTPITAAINSVPASPTATNVSNCGPGSVTLTASGGSAGNYLWYDVNGLIAGETNSTYATPTISSTTSYSVAIINGTCISAQANVSAIINTVPIAPITQGATECTGSTFTLTASGGTNGQYIWYTTLTGGIAIPGEVNSSYITTALTNNTTYFVSINNGTCESSRSPVTATVNTSGCSIPVITATEVSVQVGGTVTTNLVPLVSTTNSNLDVSSITVVKQPPSGAIASVANGVLTVNYSGVTFSGTEQITVRACDTDGDCASQVVTIDVAGDIIVYNGISPNGKNPAFIIEYINLLPETKDNTVYIFDRWENQVWHGNNYDNSSVSFTGVSDGGSELPSGVYYYKINFSSGRKTMTGFISLRR